MSIPVVIAENGLGIPVRQVDTGAPVMQVAENGLGTPIVLTDNGAPFVVLGATPAYDPRFIATRGYFPNTVHATNTQFMSETRHVCRADVEGLRLVFANAYINASLVEAAAGSAATVTASVSKSRSGPWTPFTFAGQSSGSIAANSLIETDELPFDLADGEVFFVRRWSAWTGTGRCIYVSSGQGDVANGDLFRVGTAVVDVTTGGTASGGSAANNFFGGPLAIVGKTDKAAVLIIGDSIAYGTVTSTPALNAQGDAGIIARSIGAEFGYCNASRPTDDSDRFLASNTLRRSLEQYATDVISDYGRNDLDALRSAATIENNLAAICALFTKRVWQTTIPPRATSTDGFATTANQTPANAQIAARTALNAAIRAGIPGFAGSFDVNPVLENAPSPGDSKWVPLTTTDGQHPNEAGYAAVEASGIIDLGAI